MSFFNSDKDPLQNKVVCDECKCWLDKEDAKKVVTWGILDRGEYFYCQAHKKPYSEVYYGNSITYRGMVEMEKDGTPKGYKKIKK